MIHIFIFTRIHTIYYIYINLTIFICKYIIILKYIHIDRQRGGQKATEKVRQVEPKREKER